MLDNLQISFNPDFYQIAASFDMPEGAIAKLSDAIKSDVLTDGPYECLDDEHRSWINCVGTVAGEKIYIWADEEEGKVIVSINARFELDGTRNPDAASYWPEFVAPMRKILQILN